MEATITDDCIPGGRPFRGLIEFCGETLRITYLGKPTWPASIFTPYMNTKIGETKDYKPIIAFAQSYSYRGIRLVQRIETTFYIYGDRPRIKFVLNDDLEVCYFVRGMTTIAKSKFPRNNPHHRQYQVFNRVSYADLEKIFSPDALQTYWTVNRPANDRTPCILDFWINDQFCAESLNLQGVGGCGERALKKNLKMVRHFPLFVVFRQINAYMNHMEQLLGHMFGRRPTDTLLSLFQTFKRLSTPGRPLPRVKNEASVETARAQLDGTIEEAEEALEGQVLDIYDRELNPFENYTPVLVMLSGKNPFDDEEEVKPKKKKNIFKRMGSAVSKKIRKWGRSLRRK